MAVKVKPFFIVRDKLVLKVGIHNGVEYSEEEVKKLYDYYKVVEAKKYKERSIDEIHAFDVHRGGSEDHQDSSGTWIGDAEGIYWDDSANGFGFHKINIIEEDFANKIKYQKQRGKASFGISPRLNVLRVGTHATDIIPKNISVVLTPAGGEELLLSEGDEQESGGELEDKDIHSHYVQPVTEKDLQAIRSQSKEGDDEMSKEELEGLQARIAQLEKEKEEEAAKRREAELKAKEEEFKKKEKEFEKRLAKLEEGIKKDNSKDNKKGDEDLKKDDKKKEDDKKLEDEKKKKEGSDKYFGPSIKSDIALKDFKVKPDLSRLDAKSINRVTDDVLAAVKPLSNEKGFSLEEAQKSIEEIFVILSSIPVDKKEEEELTKRVEEALSKSITKFNPSKSEETKQTTRKGLIVDGSTVVREDKALSKQPDDKQKLATKDDILGSIRGSLMGALGLKD